MVEAEEAEVVEVDALKGERERRKSERERKERKKTATQRRIVAASGRPRPWLHAP